MRDITYAEDQEAADNGRVLRVGSLVVDGAQKVLLRTGGGGNADTLGSHGDYGCELVVDGDIWMEMIMY